MKFLIVKPSSRLVSSLFCPNLRFRILFSMILDRDNVKVSEHAYSYSTERAIVLIHLA